MDIRIERVLNPKSGRHILTGGRTYNKLVSEGYVHDTQCNTLLRRQANHGGTLADNSLIDSGIPNIGVEPLKPTPYQTFKNEFVKKAGKLADWLWKLIQNRSKNNNKIVDWILNKKDQIVNKILPPKISELIELSKKTIYKKVF